MKWNLYIQGFKSFLRLEKSLSEHSVSAYLHDVEKLQQYLALQGNLALPHELTTEELQQFLKWIYELGLSSTSQARIISGLKAFYKFLILEDR